MTMLAQGAQLYREVQPVLRLNRKYPAFSFEARDVKEMICLMWSTELLVSLGLLGGRHEISDWTSFSSSCCATSFFGAFIAYGFLRWIVSRDQGKRCTNKTMDSLPMTCEHACSGILFVDIPRSYSIGTPFFTAELVGIAWHISQRTLRLTWEQPVNLCWTSFDSVDKKWLTNSKNHVIVYQPFWNTGGQIAKAKK